MGAGTLENGFWPGADTPDLRSANQSMSSKTLRGFEPRAPTADEPNQEQDTRVLDLDATRATSIDGAALIECDAFERTQDSHALRFAGAVPLFVVGVCSETKARHALVAAGYDAADIERAFANGEWMEAEKPKRATAAVAAAEQADSEARELTAERRLATDGGTDADEPRRVWVADCLDCGWQRTVETETEAEKLRSAHEGVEFDDEPTWHDVERRWERVETDGGTETCTRCPTLLDDVHAAHKATVVTTAGEELCPDCADARSGEEIGFVTSEDCR